MGEVFQESLGQKGVMTMTTDTAIQWGEWVQRARALAPIVAQWRDAGDQERHLPHPVFEALRDAGLYALAVSRTLGGAEAEDETIVHVIEELSRHDGSVGWNVMIASHGAVIASYLPAQGLREVYRGGPSTVFAGSLAPQGAAIPVPGGFRLTGRWPFASGCHQADWMGGSSAVMEHGTPRLRPDGKPDIRMFFLPVGECEIVDTWHTAGLRGTGSHDWQAADRFVPEERSFPLLVDGSLEPGAFSFSNIVYAFPSVAAVALGIARDAIDSFKALALTKTPALATSTLATQHTTHERVGRAEALLRAGRAFLYDTVRALPHSPNWSEEVSDEVRARVRLASAHAAQSAAEAVDLMCNTAGTTAIYASSRLERCFRDVHVATQHMAVAPSNIEMVGQYFLGFGLQVRR
jgi:alkylation response protein AidB-like acyl-CoA dehydrogenase